MNEIELVSFIVAEFILFFYLLYEFRSWKTALPLALASAPPLYLSLERATQFLTADEYQILLETMGVIGGDISLQWMLGSLRTTDTTLGPLLGVVFKLFQITGYVQPRLLAKSLHYLMGFVLLLWIHHLVNRHFISEANRKPYFVVFFYLAFLLPVSNLALKVFNYDLLSMLLGIITLLYLIISVRLQNSRYALLSIGVSLLATQEKATAFPILLLACSTFAYLFGRSSRRRQYILLLVGNILAVLVAILTSALCAIAVAVVRVWNVPSGFWLGIFDPLVSWGWLFIRSANSTADLRASTPLLLTVMILVSVLLSIGWSRLHTILTERPELLHQAGGWLARLNLVLIAVVVVAGVVSTFLVDAYWHPFAPIPPDHYRPSVNLNNVTLHFGARTFLQHLLLTGGFITALIANAIPSVLWIAVVGATLLQQGRVREHSGIEIELLISATLLVMLGHMFTLAPIHHRYINIWLFLFVLAVSVRVIEAVSRLKPIQQYACSAAFALLLALEVFPFRPLYAPFRPFWSHYDDSDVPVAGKINPSWMGWGEEVMLAGQIIREQCRNNNNIVDGVPCQDITLYSVYPGEWIDENLIIQTVPFWKLTPEEELSYTDGDYYLINRSTAIQLACPFPFGIEPAFVISFRGYTQAWVYQGSRLRDAGLELR